MMNSDSADLQGAIGALTATVASMERRQADLAALLAQTRQHRRERLDGRVEALLPDISDDTLDRLRQEVPDFAADPKVQAAFEEHGKILWVIKPSGYDEAFALLQAQLKLFLERQGLVSADDQTLAHFEAESSALATQQSQALAMLGFAQRAQGSRAALPEEVVRSINQLAQRGRQLDAVSRFNRPGLVSSPGVAGGARRIAGRTTGADDDDDDGQDVWSWMLTDVPGHVRDLMLEDVHPHRSAEPAHRPPETGGGDFAGAGASGDFGDGAAVCAPVGEIATDDRLGAFS